MSLLYIQGEVEKNQRIHYEVDPDVPSLGEGGMGQVLRGVRVNEQNGFRQDVAIKFLFEDLPQHAIERARREASIQIHNENLVEMFGFIEVTDNKGVKRYHVVSELLQGVMLFDLLNGKTRDKYGHEVAFAQELYYKYQNDKFGFSVFIIKNILSGLMALHDKGYIHRDLDPSNIMITHDRKVKIIDFGIAKLLNNLNTQDQQLTSTGQFIGKASYAAPELVLGDIHSQDKTTDIYSIGIMLYQFVVGSLPFDGTMAEQIKKQLNEKIPLKLVPYKAIRKIIAKATAKKQADRYQSAAEMRVALEHLTKADAVPSKTFYDGVAISLPNIGDKKKKIGIFGGVLFVFALLLGLGSLFTNSGPSEEELTQMRKDSLYQIRNGQVIDSPNENTVVDPESGAEMIPIGKMVAEAFACLDDSAKINDGISQMKEIVSKYSKFKNSAKVLAILAAITQPEDASIMSDKVKNLREKTTSLITRNASVAHEYAQMAVDADPECYEGLFELATDYALGDRRTGKEGTTDVVKANELFSKGLNLAKKNHDEDYIFVFTKRHEETDRFLQLSAEE